MKCITGSAYKTVSTDHVNYSRSHWRNILFSDESYSSIYPDSKWIFCQKLMWHQKHFWGRGSAKFGGGGVFAYARIVIDGSNDFEVIRNGSLVGQRDSGTLKSFICSYVAKIWYKFLPMENSCREYILLLWEMFYFRGRNHTNWMTSMFPRYEPNTACFRNSRQNVAGG